MLLISRRQIGHTTLLIGRMATDEEMAAYDSPPDFKNERRKREWISVRLLLAEVIGRNAQIYYDSAGAPHLVDSPLHLSISHTHDYVVAALNDHYHIGVDIERISPKAERVARHFCQPQELLEQGLDQNHRQLYYTVLWCLKEALFKATGDSQAYLQSHFSVPQLIAMAMAATNTSSMKIGNIAGYYHNYGHAYPLQTGWHCHGNHVIAYAERP